MFYLCLVSGVLISLQCFSTMGWQRASSLVLYAIVLSSKMFVFMKLCFLAKLGDCNKVFEFVLITEIEYAYFGGGSRLLIEKSACDNDVVYCCTVFVSREESAVLLLVMRCGN